MDDHFLFFDFVFFKPYEDEMIDKKTESTGKLAAQKLQVCNLLFCMKGCFVPFICLYICILSLYIIPGPYCFVENLCQRIVRLKCLLQKFYL